MREELQVEKEAREERKCNICGQPIKAVAHHHLQDHLTFRKKWGYFSAKDLTIHSFVLCEACYDKWIQTFAIPVKEESVIEIFDFPDN